MKFTAKIALLLALVMGASLGQVVAGQVTAAAIGGAQALSAVAQQGNEVQLVIEGKVVRVADGDTITVLDKDNKQHRIRFQGIDAPESKQAFGQVSKENLSKMVFGKQVTVLYSKMDKYKRVVGKVLVDGKDVNIEQLKAGLAWHYKKYMEEQPAEDRVSYARAEEDARAAKRGLWQDPNPINPSDFRVEAKEERAGPLPPEGSIVANRNSKKYHLPGCPGYRDTSEKNRVIFKSAEEAEAAGYVRAGNCRDEDVKTVASTPRPAQTSTSQASSTQATPAKTATASTPAKTTATTTKPQAATGTTVAAATTTTTPSQGTNTNTTQATGPVIGNKNSKIYHVPGCPGYDKVSEKNQIKFQTVEEAEAAGYRKAKNCPK